MKYLQQFLQDNGLLQEVQIDIYIIKWLILSKIKDDLELPNQGQLYQKCNLDNIVIYSSSYKKVKKATSSKISAEFSVDEAQLLTTFYGTVSYFVAVFFRGQLLTLAYVKWHKNCNQEGGIPVVLTDTFYKTGPFIKITQINCKVIFVSIPESNKAYIAKCAPKIAK